MIVRTVVRLANSFANSDQCLFWQTIRSLLVNTFYVLKTYVYIYIYVREPFMYYLTRGLGDDLGLYS